MPWLFIVTGTCNSHCVDKLTELPLNLVGFDTETTGLDTASDEAISYGFAVYRGDALEHREHYFVRPQRDIHEAAQRVHGISKDSLTSMYGVGQALSVKAGARRAVAFLSEHHRRGATFVGANPMFDFTMLDSTVRREFGADLSHFGLRLDELQIVDVVAHDIAIESREENARRRGLSFLAEYYGVTPGNHHAFEDARTAVEVLWQQIARNQGEQSAATRRVEARPGYFLRALEAIGKHRTSR